MGHFWRRRARRFYLTMVEIIMLVSVCLVYWLEVVSCEHTLICHGWMSVTHLRLISSKLAMHHVISLFIFFFFFLDWNSVFILRAYRNCAFLLDLFRCIFLCGFDHLFITIAASDQWSAIWGCGWNGAWCWQWPPLSLLSPFNLQCYLCPSWSFHGSQSLLYMRTVI